MVLWWIYASGYDFMLVVLRLFVDGCWDFLGGCHGVCVVVTGYCSALLLRLLVIVF